MITGMIICIVLLVLITIFTKDTFTIEETLKELDERREKELQKTIKRLKKMNNYDPTTRLK